MKVQVSSRRSRRSGLQASRELPRRTNKPIWGSPAGIRGRLCKTNPISDRWPAGPWGQWYKQSQLAAGRPGRRYKQSQFPDGQPGARVGQAGNAPGGTPRAKRSQFGAVPGGMGLGPGPEVLLSAFTPVASGLFRCRPYKRSQSVTWKESSPGRNRGYETTDERHHRVQTKPIPGGPGGTRPSSVGTNEANFRLDSYRPRPSKDPRRERMRWGTRKRLAASLRARGRACETKPIGRRALSGRETPSLRPWGPRPGRTQSRSVAPPGMSLRAQRSNLPC